MTFKEGLAVSSVGVGGINGVGGGKNEIVAVWQPEEVGKLGSRGNSVVSVVFEVVDVEVERFKLALLG